jgi:LacI family transcriptional regulator
MKITIADIARQAGVSKATVSRVLNQRPEGVGPDTRRRIQALLDETGFQPCGVARGLATGKSGSVGLIIPDITNPFHPLLVRGVEDALNQAGYSLFLCNSDEDIAKETEYVRVLLEKGVDGVILNSAASDCDCQLELLETQGVPCVVLDRVIEGRKARYGVFLDNREGARQAAGLLLAGGARRLVYLNGPSGHSQSRLRLAGLEDALAARGTDSGTLRILHGDYSIASGQELTAGLLAAGGAGGGAPFDAVFACNDLMAVGALRALRAAGIRVPEEVQVMGFDDIGLAQLVEPPLSTVAQPAFDMGYRSAELLVQLIAGKKPRCRTINFNPTLVPRGTTRPATDN